MADWWVYILYCADGTLYTGVARDAAKRLQEHNESPKAAKYTRVRRPVQISYIEPAASRSAALKRELAIKALTRAAKQQLISAAAASSRAYADSLEITLFQPGCA